MTKTHYRERRSTNKWHLVNCGNCQRIVVALFSFSWKRPGSFAAGFQEIQRIGKLSRLAK